MVAIALAGCLVITANVGLAAKKSSPPATTNTNVSQESKNTRMRKPNRPSAKGSQRGNDGKYKLLVRTEILTSDPKEGPRFTLVLRNESQSVIYVVETGTPRDFNFEVKEIYGKTVPPRARTGLVVSEGKQSVVPVKPGQGISSVIDLSNLYDLSNGEYMLSVKKFVLLADRLMTVEVKSAPLKFVFKSSK